MTVEDKLKQVILSKYDTVKAFAEEIKLSHSAVEEILSTGVKNAEPLGLAELCDGLNIDMASLIRGEINYRNVINRRLSDKERALIDKYRMLDLQGSVIIDVMLDREYSRVVELQHTVTLSHGKKRQTINKV